MSELRLLTLELTHFKGIDQMKLDFEGKDKAVVGTNEVGKTTIADAYRWLLFDKNMEGDTQFGLKPLDKNNEERHHLNTVVTGVFKLDGQQIELKKDYHEVWTRKRGTSQQKMTGHTTDYYVDDEPMKKSEYEDYIDNIISEDIFKLITDPLYFNKQLHWEDQKQIIFDLVKSPDPGEIAAEAEVYYLVDKMGNKTVDKYQKVLKSKMTKLNNKIENIPERIDEVERSLSVEGLDYDSNLEDLNAKLEEKKEKRQELQEKIAELKVDKNSNTKEKLLEAKEKYQETKDKLNNQAQQLIEKLRSKKNKLTQQVNELDKTIDKLEDKIPRKEEELKEEKEKKKELLEEYHEWEDKEFSEDQKTCPECGQELPEDQIEEHRKEFNNKKANKLEEIKQKGKDKKANIERLENVIEDFEEELAEAKENKEPIQEEVDKLDKRIKNGINYKKEVAKGNKEELEDIQANIDVLEEELENGGEEPTDEIESLEEDLQVVDKEIGEIDKKIANLENIERAKSRIKELQEEEAGYREKYEQLEQELYDTEKYIRAKIKMLQDDVNDLFEITEFKLFEEQVNGAVKETCEALKNGVPFSDMNTGSKYQVGMDIINVLSDYYDFNAPVFVDNRERIAHLPDIDSQTIHLIMTPQRKQLEVLDLNDKSADEVVENEGGVEQGALF